MSKRSKSGVAGIYRITCLPAHKTYVGRSVNIPARWNAHRWALDRNQHRNRGLQEAWRKHGADAFEFVIVLQFDEKIPATLDALLCAGEIEVLSRYSNAYNLMEAGEPGLTASDETRRKLSEERKARWANPEYRERLSASHRARHADPEFSARRGRAISIGKGTPEARALMVEQNAEKWGEGGSLRATQSAARKANWQDPDYRARQTASRKAAWVRRKAKGPPGKS